MDAESQVRLAKIISNKLVHSPWNEVGLTTTLQTLANTRRKPRWLLNVVAGLLAEFELTPTRDELCSSLLNSADLKRACKRSEPLQNLANQTGSDSAGRTVSQVADALAQQLSNSAWSLESIEIQLRDISGSEGKALSEFAEELVGVLGAARPSRGTIRRYLRHSKTFNKLRQKHAGFNQLRVAADTPVMDPSQGGPELWRVPEIHTPLDLAQWLSIHPDELWWLAKEEARGGRWEHYRRRWSKKRSGGQRLVEAPKSRLKQVQRDITHGILNRMPTHEAAHGFCVGRNIHSFVSIHADKRFAIRMDLRDFFPSVHRNQVAAIFRTAGYPDAVSSLLSRLTTTVTPATELETLSRRDEANLRHLRSPHLPQGAPTSPTLANLAAYRLDCRLWGLARKFDADYTRYADDLVFSGDDSLRKSSRRFHVFVLSIILEEGFQINARKTRMMPSAARQKAAGLVFNEKPNTPRKDYELLKATLHNCTVHGPDSQNHEGVPNFQQHLLGRVQFHSQINPTRGEKLMRAYQKAFMKQ